MFCINKTSCTELTLLSILYLTKENQLSEQNFMLFNTKTCSVKKCSVLHVKYDSTQPLTQSFLHLVAVNVGFFPKTHPVFPVLDEEARTPICYYTPSESSQHNSSQTVSTASALGAHSQHSCYYFYKHYNY